MVPPTPVCMSPLLQASAFFGSWQALRFLINREDALGLASDAVLTQAFLDLLKDDEIGSSLATQRAFEAKEGADEVPWSALASLLEGVTIEGDTALHLLATYGDGENFLKSAGLIYRSAKHLLVAQNRKGDSPLHCAARAGRSEMISLLIALASDESSSGERFKEVVRMENGHKETALLQAIRFGSNHIAELLMAADSELANFPKEGMSPLYLAVFLEQVDTAKSLYRTS
ncbi:hypothetical protein EJB05_51028, partial [Eragrostis curvula]